MSFAFTKFSRQIIAQFALRIVSYCDSGEVPHPGNKRGDIVGSGFSCAGLGRREQDTAALRVAKNCGSQRHDYGVALLALRGNQILNAQLACAAEFCHRAEQALRCARRADGRAQFHHGLVPVAGRFARQQRVRGLLQPCPSPRLAQIAANRGQPRHYSRNISIEHRMFLAESDAQNCIRGVLAYAAQARESASRVSGNMPPCSRTICCAAFCIFRARL